MLRESNQPERHARGFTIIEIISVVAIIIVLMSLLVVAFGRAKESAQGANTSSLMQAIGQSLVLFKEDNGYFPPVLDADRALLPPPPLDVYDNGNAYVAEAQEWYSTTSLAEYLIGYGEGADDGYGAGPNSGPTESLVWPSEVPPLGIRSPARDGVWGATYTNGASGSRIDREPVDRGQRLGPYLELKSTNLLAGIQPTADPTMVDKVRPTYAPGSAGYDDDQPKVIVDYWGSPIRYYRLPYPEGSPGQAFRSAAVQPSLADVVLLRPWRMQEGSASNGRPDQGGLFPDGVDDPTIIPGLLSAEFGLFSPGADKKMTYNVRADRTELLDVNEITEFNEDNIVEFGP